MNHNLDNAATPNLLRRLAAILYDLLLVAGLLMLATALVTIPVDLFLGQEAAGQLGDNLLFRLWLLAVPPAFFIGFWPILSCSSLDTLYLFVSAVLSCSSSGYCNVEFSMVISFPATIVNFLC